METPVAPRWVLTLVGLLGILLTASTVASQEPSPSTLPDRPATPEGWQTVGSGTGDVRLTLPPDIHVADASGAIFANEPPPAEGGWLQILAEGPRTAEPQPGASETLEQWLTDRWLLGEVPVGPATTRTLLLPAGMALEWRGTVRGDPLRTVLLYAIRAPAGVAFLAIDGPSDRMETRSADILMITRLLEVVPATTQATSASTGPDETGQRIVFASDRDGYPEIYTMDSTGGTVERLTDDPALETNPKWSPGGCAIVFTSDRGGDLDIYVMAADGSEVRLITDDEVDDSSADWSPDGSRLVFDATDEAGALQVFAVDSAGVGPVVQLTIGAANGKPRWSPDGEGIAFLSLRDGDQEIYTMTADGSDPKNLTDDPAGDVLPAWSPDGASIAFVSDRDGDREIYVMAADGSGVRRLTDSPDEDSNPVWSADGSEIVFTSRRDGDPDVYVMAADGSEQRDLTRNDTWDWVPDVSHPCVTG